MYIISNNCNLILLKMVKKLRMVAASNRQDDRRNPFGVTRLNQLNLKMTRTTNRKSLNGRRVVKHQHTDNAKNTLIQTMQHIVVGVTFVSKLVQQERHTEPLNKTSRHVKTRRKMDQESIQITFTCPTMKSQCLT